MRTFLLTIFYFILTLTLFGQDISKSEMRYKPKNLDEAVLQLEKIHNDTTKQKILSMTEDQFIGGSHMGLGMWMRNNWGLWRGGELKNYFSSIGIYHPDDMSGIILTSYYRHLHGQDRELEEQIKYYQEYWKATTEHFNKLKTDTAYQRQVKEAQDSLKIERLNKKKSEWTEGKVISGYLGFQCGFIDLGERTKVKGTILRWDDNKVVIHITQYFDEGKKMKVIKCNDITNDIVTIDNHENFRLEE